MIGHVGWCKDEATGHGQSVINLGSCAEVCLQIAVSCVVALPIR